MLLALTTSLFTAAYYLLIRRLNSVFPPFLLGTLFRSECLLLLLAYLAASRRAGRLLELSVTRHLRWLLVVAGCNFLIESFTIIGLRHTTALNAALFSRLDVLFAVILGFLFYRERVTMRELAAIGVLGAGCLSVLNVKLGTMGSHVAGDLLVIAGAALITSNAFLIRFKLGALDREVVAFHNVLFSTVPFALASAAETIPAGISVRDLTLLAVMGALVAAYYVVYYAALRAMPVWRLRTLLLTVPAFVLLPSVVFLRDPITWGQLGGAALVLLGSLILVLSETSGGRAKAVAAS